MTYEAACSLDGFIAAADGAVDWLHYSRDVENVMATYWATIDTVLMGRKTWDFAVAAGRGGSEAGMETYVFSRTVTAAPGVHLVASDAGDFVRGLKQQVGKGICVMGGGELAQALFEADVIDEVGLNIQPILLGSGVPLFRSVGRRIRLALKEARRIDGGCVLASYRVQH